MALSLLARVSFLILVFTVSAFAQPPATQNQNPSLAQLRRDQALRYLEPATHMALAKYYRDRGDKLMAFCILEEARRSRFSQEDFNQAFQLAFGPTPFDNSKTAEEALLNQYSKTPDSIDLVRKLADLYISREDYLKAKQFLDVLIKQKPPKFSDVAAMAETLRRMQRKDEGESLLADFVRKYPDSEDSYGYQIDQVMKTEPATAKSLLIKAVAKYPDNGVYYFQLGVIAQNDGDIQQAENYFVKAAQLDPESLEVQAWVGRFFYKVKSDGVKALPYYLNAYLISPDAYETEYAESRIQKIVSEETEKRYEQLKKSNTPLEKILDDANPLLIEVAVNELAEKWDKKNIGLLIKLMEHDDGGVRWSATDAIMKNVDRSFDPTLKALLTDSDLRKRGLAAYIAVHLWKAESFDYMRQMLKEDAQLLRFDALSALVIEGGPEGRKMVLEHRKHETNATLNMLIDSIKDK